MFVAAPAIFVEFQAILVIATVLLGSVVAFLTFRASEIDHDANVFLCHCSLSVNSPSSFPLSTRRRGVGGEVL
jgi:hypothetical protein